MVCFSPKCSPKATDLQEFRFLFIDCTDFNTDDHVPFRTVCIIFHSQKHNQMCKYE